ncbi:MAG: serine/threonine protein kinase, partial [Pirellulaceae bacterium]|nr:serine/threonine protein kinase [Pirellulaceae bacterium]
MTDSKNRLTDPTEVIPSALGDGPEKYGRYQVRGFLGRGGFGMVLKGFDSDLQRSVAIKVPLEEHRKNFDAARYQVEAQNLAKLHHPGIVAVYDVGFEGDCFYIVTERLSGVTLHEWLLQHEPTWKESAEIIAKSADALSHAHQRRVIHRDIKPGNVFMTPDRGPVLVDFGLAIAEQNAGDDIGAVRGTLRYMAPEQVEGRGHRIDGRTDIYALGVLLYQMLTGRAPYTATDKYELRRQIVNDVPQPPRQIRPDIPVSIERICMRALSKSLSKRYTTASDMVDDLRKAISQAGAGGSQEDPVDIDANAQEMMDPADVAPNRRTPLAGKRLVTALHLNISIRPTDDQPADVDPEDQIEIVDSIQTYCQKCVESFGGVLLPSSGQE